LYHTFNEMKLNRMTLG